MYKFTQTSEKELKFFHLASEVPYLSFISEQTVKDFGMYCVYNIDLFHRFLWNK